MDDYTVLLLYPDCLGNDDPRGFATYLGYGAGSPEQAVAQVRQKAAEASSVDPASFAVLAMFRGRHNDINPES